MVDIMFEHVIILILKGYNPTTTRSEVYQEAMTVRYGSTNERERNCLKDQRNGAFLVYIIAQCYF